MHLSDVATQLLGALPMDVPDPGAGTAPPGSGGFITIMGWAKWAAFGICIVSLIFAGAMMGWGRNRGEGSDHAAQIGRVLIGVAVASAAFSLVSALATA